VLVPAVAFAANRVEWVAHPRNTLEVVAGGAGLAVDLPRTADARLRVLVVDRAAESLIALFDAAHLIVRAAEPGLALIVLGTGLARLQPPNPHAHEALAIPA